MFQLYRCDPANDKKYKVGELNESRDFLLDCVQKEYISTDVAIDDDGGMVINGHAIASNGRRDTELWYIQPVQVFTR